MSKLNTMTTEFTTYYAHVLKEAEDRNHTKEQVDTIIMWLTGYDEKALNQMIESRIDMEHFIKEAPAIHPNASMIQGRVNGEVVQDMQESTLKTIRQLEVLLEQLNKDEPLSTILRK
ncbi:hypothetical protein A4S06_04600 [Erysipelotrichaceae bacterium MTC7]|nr:hypothetical protein A4S06_04600 [Erysipelotrichaceae bacterium MTC7]